MRGVNASGVDISHHRVKVWLNVGEGKTHRYWTAEEVTDMMIIMTRCNSISLLCCVSDFIYTCGGILKWKNGTDHESPEIRSS